MAECETAGFAACASHASVRPTGYHTVDEGSSEQQNLSIDMLDETNSWDSTKAIKSKIHLKLDLEDGDTVLDAGCGTGDDCREMAKLIGSSGRIVGVDVSQILIDEARRRSQDSEFPPEFVVGDVQDLSFADCTFDACRSDQTFQWLDDPRGALDELIRVTKPNGRIVVAETDYAGVYEITADPELSHLITLNSVLQMIPNPFVARHLPILFADAGLESIEVCPMFIGTNSQSTGLRSEVVTDMTEFAVSSGYVSRAEAERWANLAWDSHTKGTYWYGGLVFIVSARKPR